MRAKLAVGVAGVGLLLVAGPVWAHHSFAAEFDAQKPIKLQGTITKMEFRNPHSWIWIDVKGPDGTVVNWGIEGGSPNSLLRHGLTKSSVPPGTEIVVDGYEARSGLKRAVGSSITYPDGRKLFLGASAPGAEGPK